MNVEHSAEKDVLADRLLGVIKAHADCGAGATVEVRDDRTGTLHYPCGGAIEDPRGLVEADQRHLADALAREALTCPTSPEASQP